MAIDTYSNLQTSLQNWLARSDADIMSRIPDFIALAEASFNREVKHWRMAAQATLVTVVDTETIALPTDTAEVRAAVIETSTKVVLTLVTPQQLATNWPDYSTGVPIEYSIIGSNLHLGRTPDAVYNLKLTYYQKIPALADDATTNWLLTYNPDLYLYGALLQAAPYLRDNNSISTWAEFYKKGMIELESDHKRSIYNGGPLTSRSDVVVH